MFGNLLTNMLKYAISLLFLKVVILMRGDTIFFGLVILVIGIALMGGLTEGEEATIYFVNQQLGLSVTEGLGLAFVAIVLGLIIMVAGAVARKPDS